jgi:hypothetical protein
MSPEIAKMSPENCQMSLKNGTSGTIFDPFLGHFSGDIWQILATFGNFLATFWTFAKLIYFCPFAKKKGPKGDKTCNMITNSSLFANDT